MKKSLKLGGLECVSQDTVNTSNFFSLFIYLDRKIHSGEEANVTDTTEEKNYLTS